MHSFWKRKSQNFLLYLERLQVLIASLQQHKSFLNLYTNCGFPQEFKLNPGAKIFSPSFANPRSATPAVPAVQPEIGINHKTTHLSLPVKFVPYGIAGSGDNVSHYTQAVRIVNLKLFSLFHASNCHLGFMLSLVFNLGQNLPCLFLQRSLCLSFVLFHCFLLKWILFHYVGYHRVN